ncbi:MAG: hypothetical protein CMJ64_21580 [Planctomycetaceae bacterium]|nr:hypothetical protein [Planctomycetaceae bacterium]
MLSFTGGLATTLLPAQKAGWRRPRNQGHSEDNIIRLRPKSKARKSVLKSKKKRAEQWFVYIVRCADGSLYTGIAKDVERRIEQHNAGTASRYTRSRLPVILEYQEEQPNQSSALKRELAIKAMSRKAKEALIQSVK